MENNIECSFCNKSINEKPLYNNGDGKYYHLKCNDLINTITNMDKDSQARILQLINSLQNK